MTLNVAACRAYGSGHGSDPDYVQDYVQVVTTPKDATRYQVRIEAGKAAASASSRSAGSPSCRMRSMRTTPHGAIGPAVCKCAIKERLRKDEGYTRIDPDDPFCPTTLGEKERRVFVGAAFGGPVSVHVADPATSTAVPHIANLRGDFSASGESACRHAYVYSVPESLTSEEQLRREDPDRRARIDAIKARLRVEDL